MPKNKVTKSQGSEGAGSPSEMKSRITNYIRAGYPGLYLVSAEEHRVEAELKAVAEHVGFGLHCWSATTGLVDTDKGSVRQVNDPMEALLAVGELPEKSIMLLRDFHLFLGSGTDPNPLLIRQLKDVLQDGKTKSRMLILLGCRLVLPAELERELTVVEFALPGKSELGTVSAGKYPPTLG